MGGFFLIQSIAKFALILVISLFGLALIGTPVLVVLLMRRERRPSRRVRLLRQRAAATTPETDGPQRLEGHIVSLEPLVVKTASGVVELPGPWLLPHGRDLRLCREVPPRTLVVGEPVEVFAVRPRGARTLAAVPDLEAIFVWPLPGRIQVSR